MKEFFKKYSYIFILFFLFFLTYFIRIIYPVVSIDTEAYINHSREIVTSWFSIGRFSLGFYVSLFKLYHLNIIFSNIISFLLFFASVVILLESLVKNNNKLKIIFGLMILSSPLYAEQYAFTLQNIGIFLSLLLLIIGIILLNKVIIFKKSKLYFIIAIPFIVLAFGTYQSFYMLYISLVIIYYLYYYHEFKSNKLKIEAIVKYILVFILAFVLTFIIGKMVNHVLGISSTGYLTSQMNWINGNYKKGILYSGYYICEVLFGLGIDNTLGYSIISIFTVIYLFQNKINKDKLLFICYLMLLISPFLISILFGTLTFNRAQFSIPIVMAFLYYKFHDNKKVYILSITIVVVQIISVIYLYYIDYQRFLVDKEIIVSVMESVDKEKPIVFINKGNIQKSHVGEVLGKTFYHWDYKTERLSNDRIWGFSNSIGYYYKIPLTEQINEARQKKYKKFINDEGEYIVIDLDYLDI